MANFINNGGLELVLAMGYLSWLMIRNKIEDKRMAKGQTTKIVMK